MLRACWQVARTGARMVFTTLLLGADLSSAERAQATSVTTAPCLVTSAEQMHIVDKAGWNLIEQVDMTHGYAETARRDLRAYETRAHRVGKVLGASELATRLRSKRDYIPAIEDGLLRRELFVASVRD